MLFSFLLKECWKFPGNSGLRQRSDEICVRSIRAGTTRRRGAGAISSTMLWVHKATLWPAWETEVPGPQRDPSWSPVHMSCLMEEEDTSRPRSRKGNLKISSALLLCCPTAPVPGRLAAPQSPPWHHGLCPIFSSPLLTYEESHSLF